MIIYDRDQQEKKAYVRVEFTLHSGEFIVGATADSKPGMLKNFPQWFVPQKYVTTAAALATLVDQYAKEQRVLHYADLSNGLLKRFKLSVGQEVKSDDADH